MNSRIIGTTLKTLDEVCFVKGGKHLVFNKNAALFKERGITDMWCYNKS